MPPPAVWLEGFIVGSTLVIMASGLVLVLSIMGILNWAHGQLYMLGAVFLYYLFVQLGVNYIVALLGATAAVAAIGVAIEKWLLRPLVPKGFLPPSVAALGLLFAIEGAVVISFGVEFRDVPTVLEGVIRVGTVSISRERLLVVCIAIGVMLALHYFIHRTKIGLAIRAAAQEATVASLYGVPSGRLFTIVMATGAGLAAIAGGLIAPVYFVDPYMGQRPFIQAIMAIVLGGLGSLRGALAGGMIIGFIVTVGGYYIGTWYEVIIFAAVMAIILLRPQGLFGEKEARV
jgi:branched-chain amino acid transport system permease protein